MTTTPAGNDNTTQPWYRRLPRWARYALPAVAVVLLVFLWWYSRIPRVTLTPVVIGEAITAVYAPGTVLSDTESVVAAAAPGRLTTVLVQRGSAVVPGQVVATIDDTTARLRLAEAEEQLRVAEAQLAQVSEPGDIYDVRQAEAQLQQTQAQYRESLEAVNAARAEKRRTEAQARQATSAIESATNATQTARRSVQVQVQQQQVSREQVRAARAQLERAEAEVADARDFLTRQEALFAQNAISERRVTEARTRVRAAEAGVAEARARLAGAEQGVIAAEASADVARAQVTEAETAVEQARAQLGQAEAAVSAARAREAQAKAQATAAQEQITAAQARLSQIRRGSRASAITVSQAQVDTARAAVAQTQENVANHTVRSLITGTVSETPVEVGDYVALGAPVVNVVNTSVLYVQADVDESDIGPLALDQTTYFTTDSMPETTYQGAVTNIGANANPATNTYPVSIRNLSKITGLRVGMSVDTNIVTAVDRQALLVPASAVMQEPDPHLWLVTARARLTYRRVTIGARDISGARVQITSGVREGEQVVTNPQEDFRAGQRVRIRRP